jgi:hypothetical protein
VVLKLVDVLHPELGVGSMTFGRSLRSPDVGQTLDERFHPELEGWSRCVTQGFFGAWR